MAKSLRILIAGGGTGGHLFPGLAVAQAFEERAECEIHFVGTKRGIEAKAIPPLGYPLHFLPVQGLYRVGAFKKMLSLLKLPFAFLKAAWLVLRLRPHLVIGVGGYASGPMLLMALLLGRRVILQEQNASPGMTNRLLGRYAPLSFVPFTGLEKTFKNPKVVGNPIRKPILEAAKETKPRARDRFQIAVIGGSQGATVLNQAMMGLARSLAEKDSEARRIVIRHQTGASGQAEAQALYDSIEGLDAKALVFIEDMAALYEETDLVVARAGSMVAELNAMGKASILVPIPFSSGDHQRQNAVKMEEAGAAVRIEQAELTPERLLVEILRLMDHPETLGEMEAAARSLFAGDAAAMIAEETIRFFRLEEFLA